MTEEDAIFVHDGVVWVSAGATSGIDLGARRHDAAHGSVVSRLFFSD
jgi:transcriptional regulator GlxA family with amidase domain